MLLSFRAAARARAPSPSPSSSGRARAGSFPSPTPLVRFFLLQARGSNRIPSSRSDRVPRPSPPHFAQGGRKVRHGVLWSERKTQSERDCEPNRESQAEIGSAGTEAETEGRDLCSQQSNDRTGAAAI